jgi:Protein of unknown function (DUF3592)
MGKIIGGFVLLLVGLAMLAGSGMLVKSKMDFRATAMKAQGTVVDFERTTTTEKGKTKTMYTPVVEFTPEGGQPIRFNGDVSSSSPSYDRGDKVPVMFSAQTPEKAYIDSFSSNWMGPLILGGIGLVVALVGAGLSFGTMRQRKVEGWVKANGMPIKAKVVAVDYNRTIAVNGNNPWRISAQWQHPQTQKMYVFYSKNYWYDPSGLIKTDTLDAMVNADDPKQYWLNTDFLPAKA